MSKEKKYIGITGGIGSGKTTVASYLREKGYCVVDADQISRKLVKPPSPVLNRLTEAFGKEILDSHGNLRRKKLADMVFQDLKKQERLREIMGVALESGIKEALRKASLEGKKSYVFLDAPLIFEYQMEKKIKFSEIWLITADEESRIQRVSRRDNMDQEKVKDRIHYQWTEEEKREKATRVIENNQTEEALIKKIDRWIQEQHEGEVE